MTWPAPFTEIIRNLSDWSEECGVDSMVIGGLAASALGEPRFTRDVDATIVLDDDQLDEFVAAGKRHGVSVRRPDAIAFARRSRVILMTHDATGMGIDLGMAGLPFEFEAMARATRRVEGTEVKIPTAEDFIVMKSVAGRSVRGRPPPGRP